MSTEQELEAAKRKLADIVVDAAEEKWTSLMRCLELASANFDEKKRYADFDVRVRVTREAEIYTMEVTPSCSYPATDKSETRSIVFDPRQPTLPGTEQRP